MNIDTKYDIGDKVIFKDSKYNEFTDSYESIEREGYILWIMVQQQNRYPAIGKKPGFRVVYKVTTRLEGLGTMWHHVDRARIIKKTGEHKDKDMYNICLN